MDVDIVLIYFTIWDFEACVDMKCIYFKFE
jgi:hypothetical protein